MWAMEESIRSLTRERDRVVPACDSAFIGHTRKDDLCVASLYEQKDKSIETQIIKAKLGHGRYFMSRIPLASPPFPFCRSPSAFSKQGDAQPSRLLVC